MFKERIADSAADLSEARMIPSTTDSEGTSVPDEIDEARVSSPFDGAFKVESSNQGNLLATSLASSMQSEPILDI
jgi:hypothetical protein